MKEPIFTIQLSREEINALSVFKPELKKVLDDYDTFYDTYISRLQSLCGTLKYLSVHNYEENITKIESLINSTLNGYFFSPTIQDNISKYEILGNKYVDFISAIDAVYSDLDYVLDAFNSASPCSIEYVKEYCLAYSERIADIIND